MKKPRWFRPRCSWNYLARSTFKYPVKYGQVRKVTVTKKLGFVSYHLIRIFHGEEKLLELANNQKLPRDLKRN